MLTHLLYINNTVQSCIMEKEELYVTGESVKTEGLPRTYQAVYSGLTGNCEGKIQLENVHVKFNLHVQMYIIACITMMHVLYVCSILFLTNTCMHIYCSGYTCI